MISHPAARLSIPLQLSGDNRRCITCYNITCSVQRSLIDQIHKHCLVYVFGPENESLSSSWATRMLSPTIPINPFAWSSEPSHSTRSPPFFQQQHAALNAAVVQDPLMGCCIPHPRALGNTAFLPTKRAVSSDVVVQNPMGLAARL